MAWALIFPMFAGFIISLLPPWYFGGNPIICQHNINDRVVLRSSKNLRLETIFFWFWEAMSRKPSFRLQISFSAFMWPTHFRFAQNQLHHFISCNWCSIQVERYYQQQLGLKCLFLMTFFFPFLFQCCLLPSSIESLDSRIGRAGRDGKPAICELIASDSDFVGVPTKHVGWWHVGRGITRKRCRC